jgi:hypothetical protein
MTTDDVQTARPPGDEPAGGAGLADSPAPDAPAAEAAPPAPARPAGGR